MDVAWLVRENALSKNNGKICAFPRRPWLSDNWAAAAPQGNIGLKGIIAGIYFLLPKKNYSWLE